MELWVYAVIACVVLLLGGAGLAIARRASSRAVEAPPAKPEITAPTRQPTPKPAVEPTPKPATGAPEAQGAGPETGGAAGQAPRTGETGGAAAAPAAVERPEPTAGRLVRLRARLARSQSTLGKGLLGLLSRDKLDDEAWEEIEEILITADVGLDATTELVGRLRERTRVLGTKSPAELRALLAEELTAALDPSLDRSLASGGKPTVVLVVGVNGAGKTTTCGKISRVLIADGRTVLLGAADTFRAAAADQLQTWAGRVGAELVRGKEGGDPASVAFDAVKRGLDTGVDTVLIDTAGRLQNKVGLMDELGKVKRVVEKLGPVAETLLVLDATTGQNGLTQARMFTEAVDVTGVVLTKLDGTAKGGIVIAVQRQLGIPVKLVGLGEGPDDLAPFEPAAFVDALLGGLTLTQQEIPLYGGNTSTVVRIGATVRRNTGPWTPAVHALLRHLDLVGFTGAPKAFGIDEQGREVLSFTEGECGEYPLAPHWVTEEALVTVATMLRMFHDAQYGFRPQPGAVWRSFGPPPPDTEVVCHHDAAPHNVIWRPDGTLSLIDFDLASPGSRLYDVAYAAWTWVPLFSDRDSITLGWQRPDRPRRLRLFADAYGLIPRDRHRLVRTIRKRIVDHVEGIQRMAGAGDPAFVRIVHKGHLRRPIRDLQLIDHERAILEHALR